MKFTDWYTNALGFAAMVCGGLALLLSFVPVVSIASWALAPIAVILGVVSLNAEERRPSLLGVGLGIAALAVCIFWAVMLSGSGEKEEMAKQKVSAGLDDALVTMSKRDPGPAPVVPAVDPVTTRGTTAEGTTSAFDPPKADAAPEAITLGEYNGLANGMSYEQAARLIGSPGRMTADLNSGSTMSVRTFEWAGSKPGSVARIQFQDDKITTKTQIGLE